MDVYTRTLHNMAISKATFHRHFSQHCGSRLERSAQNILNAIQKPFRVVQRFLIEDDRCQKTIILELYFFNIDHDDRNRGVFVYAWADEHLMQGFERKEKLVSAPNFRAAQLLWLGLIVMLLTSNRDVKLQTELPKTSWFFHLICAVSQACSAHTNTDFCR